MSFRNPITTIAADQIIGEIAGSQLAADAIDGKTITAALIRTAATGERVEMTPTGIKTYDAFGLSGGIDGLIWRAPVLIVGSGLSVTGDASVTGDFTVSSYINTSGLVVNGQNYARQRVWDWVRSTSPAENSFPGGSFVSLLGGTLTDMPPGDYLVDVVVVCAALSSTVANFRLAGPPGLLDLFDPRMDLTTQRTPHAFTSRISAFGGGSMSLGARVQTAPGVQGFVANAGTVMRLTYLGPRS